MIKLMGSIVDQAKYYPVQIADVSCLKFGKKRQLITEQMKQARGQAYLVETELELLINVSSTSSHCSQSQSQAATVLYLLAGRIFQLACKL
jgi:hypothetical protein